MAAPPLEVADIVRLHGPAYRQDHRLPQYEHRLLDAIAACRTPTLGGVIEWCDHCQYAHIHYRSCRNRHCPKCQGLARARWLECRRAELLPVEYYHVVFTIPDALAPIVFYNKKVAYSILFRCVAQALLEVGRQRLGAELGFFGVLHSWGQNLHFHPHVHCVVPGGGLTAGRTSWKHCRQHFLLPVKVLSARFRQLFLAALAAAHAAGELQFFGDIEKLRDPQAFAAHLQPWEKKKWVVHAKPPFGGPQHVLEYLGRYTHRVAISNQRLRKLDNGHVSFEWKDYRDHKSKVMTVAAEEFLRLFLQHSLPPGVQRIRYYGFLANCHRAVLLTQCRQLLAVPCLELLPRPADYRDYFLRLTGRDLRRCPRCGKGTLQLLLTLYPPGGPVPLLVDTS